MSKPKVIHPHQRSPFTHVNGYWPSTEIVKSYRPRREKSILDGLTWIFHFCEDEQRRRVMEGID